MADLTRRPSVPAPGRARFPLVRRDRLLSLLDQGVELPLTLVVAPAGCGKTLLVVDWAQHRCPYAVAWFSVDAGGAAGVRFWAGLVDAVRASPGVPPDSPLHARELPPTEVEAGFVRALADALGDLPAPLVVVIDDLHLVSDLATIERLDAFIARLPPQVRLILCSRHDPSLAIHRLRLRGDLMELRGTDLAFDLEESRALLAGQGLNLSDEQSASVWRRTEGWAAALRLAALSLSRSPDPDAFISDFGGDRRDVADYLIEEVLSAEPPHVRAFLMQTSVVDRLSGDLANALTGRSGGKAILLALEREGLPLTDLGPHRTWYRYHPLLLELLRSQLSMWFPDEVVELHRRAGRWFAKHGFVREALDHALRAGDWQSAATLVKEHWLTMFLDGDGGPIVEALEQMPHEVVAAETELAVPVALNLLLNSGAFDLVEEQLRLAEENADSVPEERRPEFLRRLALVRVYLARMRGDVDRNTWAALLRGGGGSHEERGIAAVGLLNLGLVTLVGGADSESRPVLEDALQFARESGHEFVVLGALGGLSLLEVVEGRLTRALELAEEALAVAGQRGWTELTRMVPVYGALAAVALYRGETASARAWLRRCRSAAGDDTDPTHAAAIALGEALLASADGDHEAALRYLRRGSKELDRLSEPSRLARTLDGLRIRMLVGAGRLEEASELVDGLDDEGMRQPEIAVPVARLALAERAPRQALAVLAETQSPTGGTPMFVVAASMVEALAHEQLADTSAAAASVERALDLAESEGIVEPILQHGPAARRVLECAIRHGTSHRALVDELLDRLNGVDAPPSGAPLREPLTKRELAVLRYLPTSMSMHEIASEMFVSPSTVKTHVHHIYAKLEVNRRSDAVRRARRLHLLRDGTRASSP